MFRLSLLVTFLYGMCCAMAYGQTPPNPVPAAHVGSSTRERPTFSATQPMDAQGPATLMAANGGSLMRATMMVQGQAQGQGDQARATMKSVSFFSVPPPEPKTVKKHDLITIIIREESEVSSQGTTDLKRQSDMNATANQFVRLNVANMALQNAVGGAAPSIDLSGTRNFKGEATLDRTDSVTMRVSAEVLDVKPNGTLVLQARKKIKNDEEEQMLVCSGICRVEDLTPDNTVLSTQLYDLDFSKTNKGQVRATTKTGLIGKLLDFVNPF
jgi:flagellar L-ring protein precursor FlgH